MNYVVFTIIFFSIVSICAKVRNIFTYDPQWDCVDYEIVAVGSLHACDKTFKVLRFDNECKIVVQK